MQVSQALSRRLINDIYWLWFFYHHHCFLSSWLLPRFCAITPFYHCLVFCILFSTIFFSCYCFKYTGLSFPNILLGGLFGFVRAIFIGLICHFVIQSTSFVNHSAWQDAFIKPYFESFTAKAGVYLPLDILKHVKYPQRTYF